MMRKLFVFKICALLLLVTLLPVVQVSAAEAGTKGSISYYMQEWQEQDWLMSNLVTDNSGNTIQTSFVNDNGNLELFTVNETTHDRVYAQFPYAINENGSLNEYDVNNQIAFFDDANFDIDFRMRYKGSVGFIAKWYHGLARFEFQENRLTVKDAGAFNSTININDDGNWHNYTVKVRGNRCNGKGNGADCVRYVSIFMDGAELCSFYSSRNPAAYRSYKFFMDNDYDRASWAEIEYVEVKNRSSEVKITSHKSGDSVYKGQDIRFTADAGAPENQHKTVDFYVNGVKMGTGVDSVSADAEFVMKNVATGGYVVEAVCNDVKSPDVTLFVKNSFSAELVVDESAFAGDEILLKTAFSDNAVVEKVEYYINNTMVAESVSGGDFGALVKCTEVGTWAVYAKVYTNDGFITYTDNKSVTVGMKDASHVQFNREYEIDYTVTESGSLNVKDGYFEFALEHSGGTMSYKGEDGTVKAYDGILGDGDYKAVVTAGNAEIYYNGQFVFSYLLPLCSDEQKISYDRIENLKFCGSGVKATYLHKDWEMEAEFSQSINDLGRYFSVEFDKKDTSDETLIFYDGVYEVVANIDASGIWVNRQPTVGAPVEKYMVDESCNAGYYRITVADGMAQMFCNNRILGTWRCPMYAHRPEIVRSVENPSATTFLAIKGIDDIYYHNEDFEGNGEQGFRAEDYWFDESDARIEAEEIESRFSHQVATEDGNSFLRMNGDGTYFLNVSAYNPSLAWRGRIDGANGGFSVRFRDAVKFDFSEISYDAVSGEWLAENSNKVLVEAEEGVSFYESSFTALARVNKPIDGNWHDFQLVFEDDKVTLLCDGENVISADGFRKSFGKIGFGVSGAATLDTDDVEYSGEGRATAGLSYLTNGRSDFYKNYSGKVIAASGSSGESWYESEDNGETWTEIVGENGQWLGSRSGNNLNLLSGKFLRVRYSGKYTYAYLYGPTTYAGVNSISKGTEYTPSTSEGAKIEPNGSMDNVPYSGMPSRLMQIQSGPYKGRVIYCRGGSGETYGRTFMYWSDDYDGIDDPSGKNAVWHEAEIQLSYFNTGHNIQESLMVDMPDGTLRYYVRTEMGHMGYYTSSDGGETWDRPIEMRMENLISPMCCYSIQRKGNTNTYYSFWEYDTITSNLLYQAAPRNRRALAVSYDGMQTWQYVADVEEESMSASSTSKVCNHGMRYLDGAVYMSYYHGNGLHKMFRIDETKMKPLMRFTALHYRENDYATIGDSVFDKCVIPKTSGEAFVFGKYADAGRIGEVSGRYVYDYKDYYVISNNPLSVDAVSQLAGFVGNSTVKESLTDVLLREVNVASTNNDGDGIAKALKRDTNLLTFTPNTDSVTNGEEVFGRMTGIIYSSIEDIQKVFEKALTAQKDEENSTTAVALSTISNGFAQWAQMGTNKGSFEVDDNCAALKVKSGTNEIFRFGTPGLDMPSDEFIFTFDYVFSKGDGNSVMKIANGEDILKMMVNPQKITVYSGDKAIETNAELKADVWYTFKGYIKEREDGKVMYLSVSDGESEKVVCEDVKFTAKSCLRGFWFEADGSCDTEVALKNIRVYKGKAIDVITYTADGGTASATVDFLNDGKLIIGSSAEADNAVLVDEDFSEDVNFTDGVKFATNTKLDPKDYVIEVRDGAMHYKKMLSGESSFEQRIFIPKYESEAKATDIIFEYDLMIPSVAEWTQTADTAFMYFDIYIKHPVKPLRQTMYIQSDKLKVGSMGYLFKNICGTEDYDGVWMSFSHRYYFEDDTWKCDFSYKRKDATEWIKVEGAAMNASTNNNNYIRFYSYPEDQTEICVDNVKLRNVGKEIKSGQTVMGLYDEGRQLGIGSSQSTNETIGAYGTKRFVIEDVTYSGDFKNIPDVKFFMWDSIENKIPLTEAVEVKN